jgi:hypothetical protein
MNTTQVRLLAAGALFLIVFLSGIWLTHNGRPYNGWIVNFHKLLSLAAFILLVSAVYLLHQASPLDGWRILAVAVSGLLIVATIILGGLSTIENPSIPFTIVWVHRILPFVTALTTAGTLSFLLLRA